MIAARRTLRIRDADQETLVPIEIDIPVPDRTAWTCNFSIRWPEGKVTGHATAFDAVQALQFAMERIAMLLYMSPHHHSRSLCFDEPGEGYGFLLPQGSRDMAIGLDKTL